MKISRLLLAAVLGVVGCAEKEIPTELIVAAANSRNFEKRAADFVCTGSNDEAVINELSIRTENEYFMSEEQIVELIKEGSLDGNSVSRRKR